MKIRLLAFASAGDALGAGEMELEMPEGSRVADLRLRLAEDYPRLSPLWPRLAVAVDGKLAAGEQALSEGAEVALLPPVSGGTEGAEGALRPPEPGGTESAKVSLRAPAPSGTQSAEVALLPPVSGGTESAWVELVDGVIDEAVVIERVRGPGRGAVVLFLGTVRDHHAGRPVEKLTYSAYRSMARDALACIVADLERSSPDLRAAIVHRLGEIPAGEASVAIAIAAPHRAAAYDASRTALERLKAEAPIWKREHYAGGEAVWREEEPLTAVRVGELRSSD